MSTTKPTILYVDDEANNLASFKAVFRREYKIYTALSAEEAKNLLKEHDIQVIISDQRMPGKSGVEFFEEIKEEYPIAPRMLLTGYSDMESVINAINKGQVFRYITKPWNDQELRMSIDNALEVYHAKNELREKNDALQKAYNELEKFVYSASHDLRAPIASIQGIIEISKLEGMNDSEGEHLNLIEQSVTKLDTLIQNIIDYYRNSRSELKLSPISFKTLINETLENFEYYEDAQKIDFQVKVSQEDPFITDEPTIRIILNNLISNAIKYQKRNEPDKKITLTVNVTDEYASLKVEDNGIGIKEEYLQNIFEMFFRATHESAGSGLGLYIVSDAVKKINGKINVSSSLGLGTSFEIQIPYSHERQPEPVANVSR